MDKFSFDTIENFDNHIELSIPNYTFMWSLVYNLATYLIKDNTNVYDIGCATGLGLRSVCTNDDHSNVQYTGFDISKSLLKNTQQTNNLRYVLDDVSKSEIQFTNTSLVLSIFTLQFIPIKKRLKLLKKIYKGLNPGGALIISEKILSKIGLFQEMFTFCYYDFKLENFTVEEIMKKQNDLRSIMMPITEKENIKLFKKAGFAKIASFYQSFNFKAWILVK